MLKLDQKSNKVFNVHTCTYTAGKMDTLSREVTCFASFLEMDRLQKEECSPLKSVFFLVRVESFSERSWRLGNRK